MAPNPRNCLSCEHAQQTQDNGFYCTVPLPTIIRGAVSRVLTYEDALKRCDTHKPTKGSFIRICLNCDQPVRNHHKYTQLSKDHWIHKCCEHPDWPSKWDWERYSWERKEQRENDRGKQSEDGSSQD